MGVEWEACGNHAGSVHPPESLPSGKALRIYRLEPEVRVLGPGRRAAIWVQGCSLGCPGCISQDSWDCGGGHDVAVQALAEWVLGCRGVEGVTLSGGEPMDQAEGLCALVDQVRSNRDIGVVCYTGYSLERLQASGSAAQRSLLKRADLLVDGPYREGLHADLLWRASSNQRLRVLSPRYAEFVHGLDAAADRSCGLDFHVTSEGVPSFVGVPSRPGFLVEFEASLQARGVHLHSNPDGDHDKGERA